MIIDIGKWLVLYILVLFSFGCGLNQLLWYYAALEKQKCYSLPGGEADWEVNKCALVMYVFKLEMQAFQAKIDPFLSSQGNFQV